MKKRSNGRIAAFIVEAFAWLFMFCAIGAVGSSVDRAQVWIGCAIVCALISRNAANAAGRNN